MKKLFSIFIFILFVGTLSAQFTINFGKNEFYKGTVYLEDGTVKEGYVLDFQDRSAIILTAQMNFEDSYGSMESKMGFKNEFYYFREEEKGKNEKIRLSDIKKIELKEYQPFAKEESTLVYEKTKIAIANNKFNMELKNEDVLLPVWWSNNKLTVYGYSIVYCGNKKVSSCDVGGYEFYFKKPGDEYAVKPINITGWTIFALGKIEDKFYAAFEDLGKDCPEFLKFLKAEKAKNADEKFNRKAAGRAEIKLQKEMNKEFRADIKAAKKRYKKDKKAREEYESERARQYFNEKESRYYEGLYNEIVIKYVSSCE